MNAAFQGLLSPRSIAVVGASDQPDKPGHIITGQLAGRSFRVYPVSARADSVCGLPAYRSVLDIPEQCDMAVLAIPAEATPLAARQCVEAGVKVLVIVAGGFGEAGPEGERLEAELRAITRGTSTRVLGPNTLGVLVPDSGLDTLFLSPERFTRPEAGRVALVSQSGSAMLVGLDAAGLYGARLSAFVGLGNRIDLDENELLEHFATDPATASIGLYLESFADPQRFVSICREVVRRKPVVLLRAGRSEAGAKAVQLHTGSLAGSDRVTDGVLRQLGVLRAFDEEEVIDTARALAYNKLPAGRRIAVVTSGGGIGVIAADYIEARSDSIGGQLAPLDEVTQRRLRSVALPFSSTRNPIDLTASGTNQHYDAVLEILQDDPNTDLILCCALHQPPGVDGGLNEVLARWGTQGRKPLVVASVGSQSAMDCISRLESEGVPAFPSVWRAVRAIDALARRREFLARAVEETATPRSIAVGAIPRRVLPPTKLPEDEVKLLLRDYGIRTPESLVVPPGCAAPSGLPFPYPVVVKLRDADILHKTEIGGVAIGIENGLRLAETVGEMQARFPGKSLLVEQMEGKGVEFIVGLVNDPTFGLAIMCGAGGVYTELYRDVAFRTLPLTTQDADSMLDELKVGALLRGFRGISASRERLVDLLVKLATLGQDYRDDIEQMDLNPVIVGADEAVAVDAKLLWRGERVETAA